MALNTFAYDGQIRRFLIQFIRIMSQFQVEFGKDSSGFTTLQQVPVIYGDSSLQAASIIQGNTENALPTVPAISCYVSALDYDRARVQEPYHVSKVNIRERDYNPTTDIWGHTQGDAFTVERLMPVPYKLTLKVDIWTSNTTQKLQLLEQMLPLFNPALEIQSTDNYLDWTSLSAIYLVSTSWTSRTVPTGSATTAIDVAGVTFELPIWLTLPAKVKRLGVIQKIIANMYDSSGEVTSEITDMANLAALSRKVLTPLNFGVIYLNGTLQLFRKKDIITETFNGTEAYLTEVYSWRTFIVMYGATLQGGITQIRLAQPDGSELVGTVAYHPIDETMLLFTPIVDTMPSNTLLPVNAIIDPFTMPVDATFITPAAGTRYLILNDIGSYDNLESAVAWRGTNNVNLVAQANDIIEYDGANWSVSFNSSDAQEVKYMINLKTGLQFKWTPETAEWSKSIEGKYAEGDWTIIL